MTTVGLLGRADLPGRATSVGIARAFVRDLLRAAECPEVDETVLLVSELVTNAVQHSESARESSGQVTVAVVGCGGVIHVDVIDDGSAESAPEMKKVIAPDGESGRGLWLVERIAARWGTRRETTRRVVWFEILAPGSQVVEVPRAPWPLAVEQFPTVNGGRSAHQ